MKVVKRVTAFRNAVPVWLAAVFAIGCFDQTMLPAKNECK